VDFITIDKNPYEGVNPFRIKMKSREGIISFSESSEVYYQPLSFDLLVYPNPAIAWLRINADKPYLEDTVNLIDRYGHVALSGHTKDGSCMLETANVMEGIRHVCIL